MAAWGRAEVEAIVVDYFDMLRKDLAGEPYSKTAHRSALAARLDARSNGSIEFKHANISAVLIGLGLPYIDGYKPRGNYQQLLERAVAGYLEQHPDFFEGLVDSPVVNPKQSPKTVQPFSLLVQPPPDRLEPGPRVWRPSGRVVKVDFARRDAENRHLGRLGEEFVVELERRRLHDEAARPDLAKRVEWTSESKGDGVGYDIASFNEDGSPRYIEVKTTGLGKAFPFYVTSNEVRCSEALCDDFHLYRVFRFSRDAGLFILTGALSKTCALDPVQYQARFE
jgi:Protein NO VEIN, C-terminal